MAKHYTDKAEGDKGEQKEMSQLKSDAMTLGQ